MCLTWRAKCIYLKSANPLPEISMCYQMSAFGDDNAFGWCLRYLIRRKYGTIENIVSAKVSRRKTQTAVVRYRPNKLPKSLQTLIAKAHTYSKINNYSTDAMCRLRKWSALATYRLWKTGQPSLGFRRRCQYDQFKECLMFISGSIHVWTRYVKEVTVKTP